MMTVPMNTREIRMNCDQFKAALSASTEESVLDSEARNHAAECEGCMVYLMERKMAVTRDFVRDIEGPTAPISSN